MFTFMPHVRDITCSVKKQCGDRVEKFIQSEMNLQCFKRVYKKTVDVGRHKYI